jgi:glycosyltransferase involved in cell wall biosynthesis
MLKCFVNYIESISDSRDTAHIYPSYLKSISSFCDVKIYTNKIYSNRYIINAVNRLSTTKLSNYVSKINNRSLIPIRKILKCDVKYFSYVYPFQLYYPFLENTVLRINYQSNRNLKWRGVRNIKNYRSKRSKKIGNFDRIITTTKKSVERLRYWLGSSRSEVRYCPNFLPYLESSNKERAKRENRNKKVKILFVGGDGKRKGLEELLSAIDKVRKIREKNVVVSIVSKSCVERKLPSKATIKHYEYLKNSEVLNKMEEADIFCMPTKSDSYGIVFIEAMSKGCAILADDDIARQEIVAQNDVGLCVDPYDVDQIRKGLEKLIHNDALRARYMKNAVRVFKEEYSPQVVADRHYDIFQSVAGE